MNGDITVTAGRLEHKGSPQQLEQGMRRRGAGGSGEWDKGETANTESFLNPILAIGLLKMLQWQGTKFASEMNQNQLLSFLLSSGFAL